MADADFVRPSNPVANQTRSFRGIDFRFRLEFGETTSNGISLFDELHFLEGRNASTRLCGTLIEAGSLNFNNGPPDTGNLRPGRLGSEHMSPAWKPEIIALTELPEARAQKIDASFFPPVREDRLGTWETAYQVSLPAEIRGYLLQSDGLEACRGELWPVLPLVQWEVIDDSCASAHPWIRFGAGQYHLYLLSLGHSPSIYRHPRFGSGKEFFAPGFRQYLKKVFRGEA